MRRALFLLLCAVVFSGICRSDDVPDWAKHEFAASADKVFAAALLSLQAQHHEIKWKDENIHAVDFHVGTTAWSWGYNMRLLVTPLDDAHSRVTLEIARSGGKAVSWGSGKKEVSKILSGIDAQLAAKTGPK